MSGSPLFMCIWFVPHNWVFSCEKYELEYGWLFVPEMYVYVGVYWVVCVYCCRYCIM